MGFRYVTLEIPVSYPSGHVGQEAEYMSSGNGETWGVINTWIRFHPRVSLGAPRERTASHSSSIPPTLSFLHTQCPLPAPCTHTRYHICGASAGASCIHGDFTHSSRLSEEPWGSCPTTTLGSSAPRALSSSVWGSLFIAYACLHVMSHIQHQALLRQ